MLRSAVVGGAGEDRTEFVLGETRDDAGARIATFVAVAELDADGRMRRYFAGRSPAIVFDLNSEAKVGTAGGFRA